MSRVLKKGKLIPVPYGDDKTLNDVAYRLLVDNAFKNTGKTKSLKLPRDYKNFVELLEERLFEEYLVYGCYIYQIEEEEIRELFEMEENANGEYEFTVEYNDGGISHPDLLKELLKELLDEQV